MAEEDRHVAHIKCECGTVLGIDHLIRQIGACTCSVCMKRVDVVKGKEKYDAEEVQGRT